MLDYAREAVALLRDRKREDLDTDRQVGASQGRYHRSSR